VDVDSKKSHTYGGRRSYFTILLDILREGSYECHGITRG